MKRIMSACFSLLMFLPITAFGASVQTGAAGMCNCDVGETLVGNWNYVLSPFPDLGRKCRMHYRCQAMPELCDTIDVDPLPEPVPADPVLIGNIGQFVADQKECVYFDRFDGHVLP